MAATPSAAAARRFNTQPPEGGWAIGAIPRVWVTVSTHSRPKAAGYRLWFCGDIVQSFNTQPPEGGWGLQRRRICLMWRFNTQPPEGGWECRRKSKLGKRCFNTQPPEGGWALFR